MGLYLSWTAKVLNVAYSGLFCPFHSTYLSGRPSAHCCFSGEEQSGTPGPGDEADGRRQDLPILGISWPVSPLIKLLLEQHLEPQILRTLTRGQPLVFGVFGVQWSLLATLAKGSDQPHPRVTIQESLPRCGFLPIKQAISSLAHMRPSLTLYPLRITFTLKSRHPTFQTDSCKSYLKYSFGFSHWPLNSPSSLFFSHVALSL